MTYRFDLQVHTDASPCSNMAPRQVVDAALAADLDGVAITDHDTVANVDAVRDAAPPDLDVIPGVEVTTTEGHLLALYVDEAPPSADPLAVVEEVHARGGLAVLSHPFDALRQRFDADLDALAERIDGVEAANSRCVRQAYNRRAAEFARTHGVAATGGSDAHFPIEVGRAYTETDRPLREAIAENRTAPAGRGRYVSGHVATKAHQLAARFR